MSTVVSSALAEQLHELGDFDAEACMNCGVCSATCPLGIDLLPRRLFRYAVLGMGRRVHQQGEAIFACLLCRSCEENCPAGVHITENVRLLRRWLLTNPEEGH
ncbi:MAG TPA: 4Fe-4S dicluster domain-containing protein [Acidimicrobiales bacterium]|nr:4Fe-4S dicluster domain-containing protein [Acidimicrobiales bacterium]